MPSPPKIPRRRSASALVATRSLLAFRVPLRPAAARLVARLATTLTGLAALSGLAAFALRARIALFALHAAGAAATFIAVTDAQAVLDIAYAGYRFGDVLRQPLGAPVGNRALEHDFVVDLDADADRARIDVTVACESLADVVADGITGALITLGAAAAERAGYRPGVAVGAGHATAGLAPFARTGAAPLLRLTTTPAAAHALTITAGPATFGAVAACLAAAALPAPLRPAAPAALVARGATPTPAALTTLPAREAAAAPGLSSVSAVATTEPRTASP